MQTTDNNSADQAGEHGGSVGNGTLTIKYGGVAFVQTQGP
jgi:hypothetical protein